MMPRILHVLDHSIPLHSGYTFRTRSILQQQRALGWQTEHLTSPKHEGAQLEVEEVDGLRFHRTIVPTNLMRRLPVIGQWMVVRDTQKRLEQLIPELKPDLLHAHSPSLNGIAALRAARRFNIPVVYEIRAFWEDAAVDHGTTNEGSIRYRLSQKVEQWLLKRVHAITVICQGLYDDLIARGVAEKKITVIPNAVDVERFPVIVSADAPLKARLGLQDAVVLGFIGSFYGYEGLDTLIDALPDMLRVEPRTHLLLVGGGFEEARLREQAIRLGVQGHVLFTGRVPNTEVSKYYSVIDLLVYPRKSMRLTNTVTPLKPLEAMAQGKLVAASNVGGHRELINDGITGFLFQPDNARELAACVIKIFQHTDRWAGVRAAGRTFVETERTWARSVARYRSVYSAVLQQPI
jgi:PEP-CTERM/exosortase A-associated glycosyltransferase